MLWVARVGAALLYALLALAGALFSPITSLTLGVLAGAAGWAAVSALHRPPPGDLPPLAHPLTVGAVMAWLPAAIAGIAAQPRSDAPALVLAVLAATWFMDWLLGENRRGGGQHARPEDDTAGRGALEAASMDLLLAEWRILQLRTARSSRERLLAATRRGLLLDEFQRRDPEGTARWLVDGPGASPADYIGHDADR